MGYRILVDENVDPQTAELLCGRGHDAVHVQEALGKGTADSPVAEFAREHAHLVLTNDTDFLRPERHRGLSILYCPDNAIRPRELAMLVADLETTIPDQTDLPEVTWVTEETFS